MTKRDKSIFIACILFFAVGIMFLVNDWGENGLIGVDEKKTSVAFFRKKCVMRIPGRPDPRCTPGAVNQGITEKNMRETICNPYWSTRSIRPPVSYTNPLKRKQMREYGFLGIPSQYEEDHLIPLELGGDPVDPRNLWPQPRKTIIGWSVSAEFKDQVETYVHARVCVGHMTLASAQQAIATDWQAIVGRQEPAHTAYFLLCIFFGFGIILFMKKIERRKQNVLRK